MAKLDLKNKKFIISAAAEGIGFAIADKIVSNGGIVFLTDIDKEKINKIKLKKKYKNKIFFHKRSQDLSIENTLYRNAILNSINKVYKKKKPDYVLILNFEYPLRESFYIEKAINCIQIFGTDKLISANVNLNDQFYMHDGKGLKLLNNSKHDTLHLEKKMIYLETGGISIYRYNLYKEKSWSKISNIGHIIIDKNSSFKVENISDLNVAKKLLELKK